MRIYRTFLFTLCICVGACDPQSDAPPRQDDSPSDWETLRVGEAQHSDLIENTNVLLETAMARAKEAPHDWMPQSGVAQLFQQRARLTGSFDDYVLATAWMDRAFERAPQGSGPWLLAASLQFTIHRLETSEAFLLELDDMILVDDSMRASIDSLRGDIALQRGHITDALVAFEYAETLDPSSGSLSRIAHAHWRRGEYDVADELYKRAKARYHGSDPSVRAWMDLQRGILDLDRGEDEAALDHFLDANDELSGYYLIEEHIAEVWNRLGYPQKALELYLDILTRAPHPEFMDAVADIYNDLSDEEQSTRWRELAEQGYQRQMQQIPSAAIGHALQHYLAGEQSDAALALALENYSIRPNGESLADLGLAYLKVGQSAKALDIAFALHAGQWKTVPTLEATWEIFVQNDQTSSLAAIETRSQLCAIAPRRCPE